jgi:hypothetical protein
MSDAKLGPQTAPLPEIKYYRKTIIASAIVATAVIISIAFSPPMGLKLKENITQQLGSMFGFLLMVSLFVERAIEVIISIWSDPQADRLQQRLEILKEARSRHNARIRDLITEQTRQPASNPEQPTKINEEIDRLREKLRQEQDEDDEIDIELIGYGAHTRQVAAWIGLAIGVLTAGVGFRVLHTLFVEPPPMTWGLHNTLFTVVDVLLTGALLSGGSKAVHHLFNVYETVMEATTKKAEAAKASAGE